MKYLKLFESTDYYYKISNQEFNLSTDYTENPYSMIRKLRSILPDVEYTSLDSEENSITFNSKVGNFIIKFSDDEWFKVKSYDNCWKCDQLDGLILLFKHLKLL
jgi:hypothetical protein